MRCDQGSVSETLAVAAPATHGAAEQNRMVPKNRVIRMQVIVVSSSVYFTDYVRGY